MIVTSMISTSTVSDWPEIWNCTVVLSTPSVLPAGRKLRTSGMKELRSPKPFTLFRPWSIIVETSVRRLSVLSTELASYSWVLNVENLSSVFVIVNKTYGRLTMTYT